MRKLSHEEILSRQQQKSKEPKLPFIVVLNNIRSLYNVGSIFRSADGAGVVKIWLCGITGHPPNNQIAKTALGAQDHVNWEHREDAPSLLRELKAQGYEIVLLEQMRESLPYNEFKPQGPLCLVIGNEINGIAQPLVEFCDTAIEIEMDGSKNSLNVAVAFGVVAFHIKQHLKASAFV